MRKIIAASFLCISLIACKEVPADYEQSISEHYSPICIDGVEYWYSLRGTHGGHESLAVRIDPETLKPVRCDQQSNTQNF